mmetsp:Transcript_49785/g.75741  ORF Transcript_49785/g.75741 Transcript_49785/m.75741 type:complete len:436 (+) Transcript_49785:50-1357(+)
MRATLMPGAHTSMPNLDHCQSTRMYTKGRSVVGVGQTVQVLAIWMLVFSFATNLTFATDLTPSEGEAHVKPANQTVGTEGMWRHEIVQLGDRLISRTPNIWKGVGFVAQNVSSYIATYRQKLIPHMQRAVLSRRNECTLPDGSFCGAKTWVDEYNLAVQRLSVACGHWLRPTVNKFVAAVSERYRWLQQHARTSWGKSKQFVQHCSNAPFVEVASERLHNFSSAAQRALKQGWNRTQHSSIALWTAARAAGSCALKYCELAFANTGEAAKTVIVHGILLPTRKCYAYWTVMSTKLGKPLFQALSNLPSHFANFIATAIPRARHLTSCVSQWIKKLLEKAWAKHQKVWAFQTRLARALWREAQAASKGLPESSADKLRHAKKRVVSWWVPPEARQDDAAEVKGTTSQIEQEKNFARWKAAADSDDSDEIGHDDDEI